jgi:hypothetical protein
MRWLLIASLVVLAACSPDPPAAAPEADPAVETTTTTGAPVVLGLARELDLQPGQCYAPLPPQEPEPATPPAETTTTVPTRVVADCAGPHTARVFAAFCLVQLPDGSLDAGPCPEAPATPWPGDREVRRAAVRVCLQRFEAEFGEPYATSELRTEELTPTKGAWLAGDQRVVCAVRR